MKKVLFLIGSLQGGGAEKVLVDTVNSLDREKYQITVQTLFDCGVHRDKLAEHVRYRSVVPFKNEWVRRLAGKVLFFLIPVSVTYSLFIRDHYDFEIAFLEGLPTKVLAKSTNKAAKKIAWIHTDLIRNPASVRAFGSESAEKAAYDCFDKVFCVSKSVEDAFVEKYGPTAAKADTLYNILDDAAVIEAAGNIVTLPVTYRPCFISVGRLTPPKGYDRLLRIHKRLVDEGLMHSLLIIGEGEMREGLEQYIQENDLQNSVCLMGFQRNPYQYISKADLFVCSSYAEGFSTVVTEAILCGTPVVGTDVAGNREPEEAPRCSVITENSEEALYEALRRILKDPQILETYRAELISKQAIWEKQNLIDAFEKAVFFQ